MSILLWRMQHALKNPYAVFTKQLVKRLGFVLPPSVRHPFLYTRVILGFDHSKKVLEGMYNTALLGQMLNPCMRRIVIEEGDSVLELVV